MKERTKSKLKDIARDLIKLYAARRRELGFAYSADSYMQQELEASFLYEDTPDQLKATNDVKADMEKAQPMDRLVCGDVGFGYWYPPRCWPISTTRPSLRALRICPCVWTTSHVPAAPSRLRHS